MVCSGFGLLLVALGVMLMVSCNDDACYEKSLGLQYVFGFMIILGAAVFATCMTVDAACSKTWTLFKDIVLCKCCRK